MNQPASISFSGRPAWLNHVGSFSSIIILILMPLFVQDMALILIVFNILAALLIMLTIVYNRYTWEFSISDGDVQSLQGIMSKKQKSVRLKSIRKVEEKQTTIQGIFGVGDIIFTAAGNNMVVFCGIKSPSGFKEKILKAQK